MATPTIDLGIVGYFSPILLVIFVFAVIYGVMQWSKLLGDNKVVHSVIAFIAAIFVAIISPSSATMLGLLIPWFTAIGIFLVLTIMLYKIFGTTDDQLRKVVSMPMVYWTMFIIVIIIFLGALSQAFGQRQLSLTSGENMTSTGIDINRPDDLDTGTGNFNQNMAATFYNPKVLGMILLFLVGALTVATLSRPVVK